MKLPLSAYHVTRTAYHAHPLASAMHVQREPRRQVLSAWLVNQMSTFLETSAQHALKPFRTARSVVFLATKKNSLACPVKTHLSSAVLKASAAAQSESTWILRPANA